jgi:hypothetical protein
MELRAILTCVDYADILALSLPWNRRHFSEVFVVTTPRDTRTAQICDQNAAYAVQTDLFYESGPDHFNKWRALEHGLDVMGRSGWICIMDADVFWPSRADLDSLQVGNLCSPLRRMAPLTPLVPSEQTWAGWPIHRNVNEWAGYTQIFHASDPHLGTAPWHETNWIHCGGADSFFQQKWPRANKVRPDWEVLHMGPSGTNWFGRASEYIDGTLPGGAEERQRKLRETIAKRRKSGFGHEKY